MVSVGGMLRTGILVWVFPQRADDSRVVIIKPVRRVAVVDDFVMRAFAAVSWQFCRDFLDSLFAMN